MVTKRTISFIPVFYQELVHAIMRHAVDIAGLALQRCRTVSACACLELALYQFRSNTSGVDLLLGLCAGNCTCRTCPREASRHS